MQAIAIPWWSLIVAAMIPTLAMIFHSGKIVAEHKDVRKRLEKLEGETPVIHAIDNRLTRVETKIDILVESHTRKNAKNVSER